MHNTRKFCQFKGHLEDGSNRYSFNCQLSNFEPDVNDFCGGLAPFVSDALKFCTQLCSRTSGVVNFISETPPADPLSATSSSAPCLTPGQKRGSNAAAPSTKKRKIGYQEKMNDFEEEIPEHQIGKLRQEHIVVSKIVAKHLNPKRWYTRSSSRGGGGGGVNMVEL